MSRPFMLDPQCIAPREALELLKESMGEVIDLGTSEINHERPGYAMLTLQKLRAIEGLLLEVVRAEANARPEVAE